MQKDADESHKIWRVVIIGSQMVLKTIVQKCIEGSSPSLSARLLVRLQLIHQGTVTRLGSIPAISSGETQMRESCDSANMAR